MPKPQIREESLSEFATRVGHQSQHVARIRESLQAHLRGETVSTEEVLRMFDRAGLAAKAQKHARA